MNDRRDDARAAARERRARFAALRERVDAPLPAGTVGTSLVYWFFSVSALATVPAGYRGRLRKVAGLTARDPSALTAGDLAQVTTHMHLSPPSDKDLCASPLMLCGSTSDRAIAVLAGALHAGGWLAREGFLRVAGREKLGRVTLGRGKALTHFVFSVRDLSTTAEHAIATMVPVFSGVPDTKRRVHWHQYSTGAEVEVWGLDALGALPSGSGSDG